MTVGDLKTAMDALAPPHAAEAWDNVGLLIGDPAAGLTGVLLCIDLTPGVLDEAADAGANAVVAYHPPIFKGIKRLTPAEITFECVRRGVAVYSPHTALDVAAGGTCDMLADALGLIETRPLRPTPAGESSAVKLVVYAPTDAADAVADALFDAGAGSIGRYDRCAFRSAGVGSFRGGEGTNPAVGTPGREERVEEVRLETIVPADRLDAVTAALRAAHPYEEPAFDLFPRRDAPAAVGMGRVGRLAEPATRRALVERAKRELGVDRLLLAGPDEGDVTTAAVGPGSCGGDLLRLAAAAGAGFYLTGELRHHDALLAARLGVTACCVLHSNSERPVLGRVRAHLEASLPGVSVRRSDRDRDPFDFA